MKTTKFLAIFFVAMVVFETFYPLGDLIHSYIGYFGDFLGIILALGGLGSLAWEIAQILERFEVKNNIE